MAIKMSFINKDMFNNGARAHKGKVANFKQKSNMQTILYNIINTEQILTLMTKSHYKL